MSLGILHNTSYTHKIRDVLYPPEGTVKDEDVYGDAEKNQAIADEDHPTKAFTSISLTFFCTFLYLFGVASASDYSVWWELCIIFGFPLFGVLAGWERWTSAR